MGDVAIEEPKEQPKDEETPVEEEAEPKDGDVTPEGEEEKTPEPQKFEVVRKGSEGSQTDEQRKLDEVAIKVKRREKRKRAKSDERANEADQRASLKDEENQLLKLRIQQLENAPQELKQPDPDDFEDTAKYREANSNYTQSLIEQEVKKQTANFVAPQQAEAPNQELERSKRTYYTKAIELGADDFEEAEDRVIDAIGEDALDHLIQNSDKPHLLTYYLGNEKNKRELDSVSDLLKTNPVKATLQLGRLEAELEAQPSGTHEPAPNPDDELEGGTPGSPDDYERKLDKLRDKAVGGNSSDVKRLIEFKKRYKEQGVTK